VETAIWTLCVFAHIRWGTRDQPVLPEFAAHMQTKLRRNRGGHPRHGTTGALRTEKLPEAASERAGMVLVWCYPGVATVIPTPLSIVTLHF
jgi:hypothetical protein